MKVGTIKEIWRYPAKSMFGERVERARVDLQGFADDRCWVVRDDISGEFVNGRTYPKLMMLKARYLHEPECVFGPAAEAPIAIEFPDGRVVESDDPDVSAILSMFVGARVSLCSRPSVRNKTPYRLNKPMSPREIRYALGMQPDDPDPDFSSFSMKLLMTLSRYTAPPGALYDVYPLHFVTTAAIEAMRCYEPQGDFRVERYRPSFVIETGSELTGLAENDWRGRKLQIGGAQILCNHPTIRCSMPGVAQPGIDPDANVPRAVMRYANQHFGAYATPLQRADIRVGDTVELLPQNPSRTRVFFDQLGGRLKSRAIGASNAVAAWQEKRALQGAEKDDSALPKGFQPFTVLERVPEATGITSFVFASSEQSILPRFLPGQHIVLAIPQGDGRFVYRPYSLSAAYGDGRHYRITVKQKTTEDAGQVRLGLGSSWLHQNLAVGDTIALKGPAGQFADVPCDETPLILLSTGIGITPFMAVLGAIAERNPERPVHVLHAVRRLEDFAFQAELEGLHKRFAKLEIRVFVSQPEGETMPSFAQAGRMKISEVLPSVQATSSSAFYLCGTPSFIDEARQSLLASQVPLEAIHVESFGRNSMRKQSDAQRYQIQCTQSHRHLEWDPEQDSLLSFVEEHGIEASSGCRYGACGACEVTLLAGQVEYPAEIQAPAGKNKVLLCSARPKSNLELEM